MFSAQCFFQREIQAPCDKRSRLTFVRNHFTLSASCWWIKKQLYGSRDSLSSAHAIARFTATSEERLRLSARGTTADEKVFTFFSNPLHLKQGFKWLQHKDLLKAYGPLKKWEKHALAMNFKIWSCHVINHLRNETVDNFWCACQVYCKVVFCVDSSFAWCQVRSLFRACLKHEMTKCQYGNSTQVSFSGWPLSFPSLVVDNIGPLINPSPPSNSVLCR